MTRVYTRNGKRFTVGGSRSASRLLQSSASALAGAGIVALAGLSPTVSTGAVNTSSFGLGLGGLEDWEQPRFIDRAKHSRTWIRPNWSEVPSANLDSDGNLTSLPSGDTYATFFFNAGSITYAERAGRFRLWFDGEATVTFAGVSNVSTINANTYEFDATWVGDTYAQFTPTNPANMPRNVKIVRTDLLTQHANGAILDPDLHALLADGDVGCLRFMDWMGTNFSPIAEWSEYPKQTHQNWRRCPIEVMVSLCNALQCDGWFCIPHKASDDFITQMATYLRDNMDPGLKIRIEYSNEVWNDFTFGGSTGQATYAKAQALALWGTETNDFAWCQWGAKRFVEACDIFDTVFAGQTDRLIRVLATQVGFLARIDFTGRAPLWQANDPSNYVAPHSVADEISVAPYFGNYALRDNAAAIKSALDVSVANAVAQIKTYIPSMVATTKTDIDNSFTYPNSWGKPLTAYEFNQHLNASQASSTVLYSGGNPVAGFLTACEEVCYSQEIADAQDELRAYFKTGGGRLISFFVDIGRVTQFGAWGARRHQADSNPVWTALVNWHAANPKWW